ncbi:short-chain dehydrogenase reductase family protein [Diaporthe amygdali]|uniref:short-chain dehydrogenase reductase family protein n=1 Tax=Phomopsis amygdali TaxID=1214568 RepID=UPI0022FEE019|nr:short-chain dehydrogenase reductase family protein [Diaporthe amygdali]KAJ0125107.1 short-chain dehydrogenase reductase family protein [Diaporthe amygdali]
MPPSGEHMPLSHIQSQYSASSDKRDNKNKNKNKKSTLKSEVIALLLFTKTMSLKNFTGKFFPSSLPPANAFAGQKVLVTGGTAGLGLAAAIHFHSLGAEEVIITARSASSSRAEDAKKKIIAGHGAGKGTAGKVSVMELDMNSYGSCVAFVDAVKGRFGPTGGPDVVVFNAGVTNSQFRRSPEGMEEIIQVNTLSTTLLALLLIPWMKQQRGQRSAPAHAVFVSSGLHMSVDIKTWAKYTKEEGGVLAHYSKEENFEAGLTSPMYNYSKLMLMYALEEVTKMASDKNGEPQVIVTSVCPGAVKTELSRSMQENSVLARIVAPLYMAMIAKSPDYGARIYLAGALAGPAEHGKFLRDYITDAQYASRSAPVLTSKEARLMQAQVWKEIREALSAKVPAVQETV